MPLTAILLVLGAGFLHASWNLILKRTSERLLVTSWGLLIGAVVFVPALLSGVAAPRADLALRGLQRPDAGGVLHLPRPGL